MLGRILEAQLKKSSREFDGASGGPYAIIGMHRSGTSMVARVLRHAGGYFGYRLDPNSEAIVFLRFNDNFLRCAKASWDFFPTNFCPEALSSNGKAILCFLSNKALLWSEFFEFFGETSAEECVIWRRDLPILNIRRMLRDRNSKRTFGGRAVALWGWKDPRTTMTLSFWLKVFPNAKVIHVIRNGIDASLSLWRRSQKSGEGAPRCLNLEYCFELWEKYVHEGRKWRCLGEDRYIEVRYEHLLRDPIDGLKRLFGFSGVPAWNARVLNNLIKRDGPARGFSKELDALIERAKCSEIFRDLGYER